jgi:hypothetical protein
LVMLKPHWSWPVSVDACHPCLTVHYRIPVLDKLHCNLTRAQECKPEAPCTMMAASHVRYSVLKKGRQMQSDCSTLAVILTA